MSDTAFLERARLPATRHRGVPAADGFPSVSSTPPFSSASPAPSRTPGKVRRASSAPQATAGRVIPSAPPSARRREVTGSEFDWARFDVPGERADERGFLATPEPDREAMVIFLILGTTALALLLQATATAVFFVERWQSFERFLDGFF